RLGHRRALLRPRRLGSRTDAEPRRGRAGRADPDRGDPVRAVILVLVAACGSSSSAPDAPSCEPACFEQRWWTNVALANCNVFCMASPSLPECAHADCKQVSAEQFAGGTLRTLGPMTFSAELRSFDLLGAVMTQTYSATADCHVAIDSHPSEPFA